MHDQMSNLQYVNDPGDRANWYKYTSMMESMFSLIATQLAIVSYMIQPLIIEITVWIYLFIVWSSRANVFW